MEIRCPKSMLNVAERAKKGKNRYISGFRARSGRRGRRFKSCIPDHVGTSFACSDFYLHKNQSLTTLFLLFHKKSRSARLFGCKRPYNDSLSLQTFCEFLRFLRFLLYLKKCQKAKFDHMFLSSTVGQNPFLCLRRIIFWII